MKGEFYTETMSLLLLDLDGTIRETLSGKQYFQHPQDQKIIPGAEIAIGTYSKLQVNEVQSFQCINSYNESLLNRLARKNSFGLLSR